MSEVNLLPVGGEAPAFEAETSGGERVRLADFRGRGAVLLMFYPPHRESSQQTIC